MLKVVKDGFVVESSPAGELPLELAKVKSFYVSNPTFIKATGKAHVAFQAAPAAWFDQDKGAPVTTGPFPVLALGEHGEGRVAFISSHFHWSNAEIGKLDNEELACGLVAWCRGRARAEVDKAAEQRVTGDAPEAARA